MKLRLQAFSSFHWFKEGICQLMAKECACNTDKLPTKLETIIGLAHNELKCVERL